MKNSKSQKERLKLEPKFSQEQFEMLKRCSEKKDVAEWNEWRKGNHFDEILLENANLRDAELEGADLQNAYLKDADLEHVNLKGGVLLGAYLKGADLYGANLEGANLSGAHLEGATVRLSNLKNAYLVGAYLEGADLSGAIIEGADLNEAHLEGSDLYGVHMERAYLIRAHMQGANLSFAHLNKANLFMAQLEKANLMGAFMQESDISHAHLEGADLSYAHLEDARLEGVHLEGARVFEAYLHNANFQMAIVDGATSIWEPKVDRDTNFRGVGFSAARIDSGTKQLLECNIRRMNWEKWYEKHSLLKWPIKGFWVISDYGRSVNRIAVFFLGLILLFALVFYFTSGQSELGFVRICYLSLVSMIIPGRGGMYAGIESWGGRVLWTVQIFLGYLLFAAVVARLAVLFIAGGPAGKFSKRNSDAKGPKPEAAPQSAKGRNSSQ